MVKIIREYAIQSKPLSIDSDYKPFRNTIAQKSVARIPGNGSGIKPKITPNFDYTLKSTALSIDSDFKLSRETLGQKSATRIPGNGSSMKTKLTPDFDVDRIIQYFQKQRNVSPIPR